MELINTKKELDEKLNRWEDLFNVKPWEVIDYLKRDKNYKTIIDEALNLQPRTKEDAQRIAMKLFKFGDILSQSKKKKDLEYAIKFYDAGLRFSKNIGVYKNIFTVLKKLVEIEDDPTTKIKYLKQYDEYINRMLNISKNIKHLPINIVEYKQDLKTIKEKIAKADRTIAENYIEEHRDNEAVKFLADAIKNYFEIGNYTAIYSLFTGYFRRSTTVPTMLSTLEELIKKTPKDVWADGIVVFNNILADLYKKGFDTISGYDSFVTTYFSLLNEKERQKFTDLMTDTMAKKGVKDADFTLYLASIYIKRGKKGNIYEDIDCRLHAIAILLEKGYNVDYITNFVIYDIHKRKDVYKDDQLIPEVQAFDRAWNDLITQ